MKRILGRSAAGRNVAEKKTTRQQWRRIIVRMGSIKAEVWSIAEFEMLTHSATDCAMLGSGMREHFDELAFEYVPAGAPNQQYEY